MTDTLREPPVQEPPVQELGATPADPWAGRLDFGSEQAQRRIKRRYRSESRFKAYGLFAIGLTAAFLVLLLTDILRTGLPAFWQHSLELDVPVRADIVDPDGRKAVQSIRGADYFPLTRDALDAALPGIEGRAAQRRLTQLLSTGAADELRERLVAEPSLIGQTVKARLLLSDDADLYFKGKETAVSERVGQGGARPSGVAGEITVTSSAADFAAELLAIRRLAPPPADTAAQPFALDDKLPSLLVAINGGLVKVSKLGDREVTGEVLLPLKSAEEAASGAWRVVTYVTPESNRKVSDLEVAFLEQLKADGRVQRHFNWRFFQTGDSREPELAGIRGALMGTVLTLLVTLFLCVPIGVLAAVYLEEFAPKNKLTDLIEVNINNLAAVPSIVFGLLGLAVFLNFFGMPRSIPLVGGLVLALLVLPTIIIASRAAIKAVPPSIREAALGVGASKQQAVFHHVLPLAMPGIMTGTIIGMAHALGETAPLLMIGMVAFIVDVPSAITQAATVLPVQIFLWADLPEPAFRAKTAAAIMVLLAFLFVMNGLAIWLRRRFERRW